MIKNYLKLPLLVLFALITGIGSAWSQVTITQWNFDQQNLTPSTGAGTASTIGGTIGSFATGNPVLYAWSTTTYPEQATNSGTAGVQFDVSTIGYNEISIAWENRNSGPAANRLRLQYTLNGTDWLNFTATDANATNINDGSPAGFDAGRYITDATDWFLRSADFSGITGVEQNPDFAVRFVTEFTDATNYTGTSGAYATDGTIRFENVTFTGVAGAPTPVITSVLMPQYISGNLPANNRLPFAYRATIDYLQPLTTYRYINMVVTSSDDPTSAGSGAIIYVNANGTFTRTPVGSFTTHGEYGEFTTDASGSYTGWFITEPTTNTRFTPGNQVFMRIRLNDGANGTTDVHYLTTQESVNVLGFSVGNSTADGTGIRAVTLAGAKNFAMIYDNVDGTGRPLFGTSIESTGIDFTTLLYPSFFQNFVAGINGTWGGIVPNVNASGVRLIEERSRTTGAVVSSNTSVDGMWGTTNTANPTGGIDDILVIDLVPASELIVTPTALNGFSYMLNGGPSMSQSYTISGVDLVGTGNITVTAPASFEISTDDINWVSSLDLPYEAGIITGQPVSVYVRLKANLAYGNYANEMIVNEGGNADPVNVACSGQVNVPAPVLASEVVPAYIQGINGTNVQRVPLAWQVTLNYLVPNATYRYYHGAVLGSDLPDSDGAGNMIFVNSDTTFTRTEAPSLSSSYGEFTADASGNFTGWLLLEPNGDNRFTPGNQLYMRLMLNDGANGTAVINRITTTTYAAVINFGTETDPDAGTGIRGISESAPGNMVFLFDNETGTGRPVCATSIESTGVNFTAAGVYAGFYATEVAGIDGSWGGIVPNVMPNGVRRIEERSIADGSLIAHWTSTEGIWGEEDTRNPVGGDVNELVIDLMPIPEPVITATPTEIDGFTYILGNGPSASQSYALNGANLVGTGNISVTAPAHYEISLDDVDFVASLELLFADGIITGQPVMIYTRLMEALPAGTYNNDTIIHNGGGAPEAYVTLNGEVALPPQPAITDITLPQYIQGINGSNDTRVPFVFRATLSNLKADSTYRFYNRVVISSDAPDNTGAGNPIFVNTDGTFTRTTGTSLGTPGQYGEFTADAEGTYTGWFMIEPTGNDRFTPGNSVFMRIMINDGSEGTTVANYITSADSCSVLKFDTEPDALSGTAIRAISYDEPGDFVFLYDGIESTERPIYATSIETTGIDFAATGSYAPFYANTVAGVNGSWGGIVPNLNTEGIQQIKVFANATGELQKSYEMASGIWGITDTRNPSGGVDEVLFLNLQTINVPVTELTNVRIWSRGDAISIQPETGEDYTLTLVDLQGRTMASYSLNGNNDISLNMPAGIYVVRFMNKSGVYTTKLFLK